MSLQQTPEQFSTTFPTLFTRSAFRLETLDFYQSAIETEPFRRFRAGAPDDLAWRRPWQQLVRDARAAGKTMARVHIVTEPLSDYLRFQLGRVYPASVEAGEDIGIIQASDVDLLGGDFWLIDDTWTATMHYSPDGQWLGVELTDDPVTAADRMAWRDILQREAEPLTEYRPRTRSRRQTA